LDTDITEAHFKVFYNECDYKLEQKLYLDFGTKSRLMIRYILGPLFLIVIYVLTFILIVLSVMAYFDTDMDFSILSLTLAGIMLFISLRYGFATVMAGFCAIYLASVCMELNFIQITVRIKKCMKSRNSRTLINAIHEHNNCAKLVETLNTKLRITYCLVFFHLFLVIFIFNYILTSVSTAAHEPKSYLYELLVRNKCNLQHKLKITALTEKFDGPVIGFYCYDLFLFTTYEFYEYLAFASSSYFLLNVLIFHA
jgi:hypothetical protein